MNSLRDPRVPAAAGCKRPLGTMPSRCQVSCRCGESVKPVRCHYTCLVRAGVSRLIHRAAAAVIPGLIHRAAAAVIPRVLHRAAAVQRRQLPGRHARHSARRDAGFVRLWRAAGHADTRRGIRSRASPRADIAGRQLQRYVTRRMQQSSGWVNMRRDQSAPKYRRSAYPGSA